MQEKRKATPDGIMPQKRDARKYYRSIYKHIKPSCVHTWHWSEESFEESAQWLLDHSTDVRHGIYMSDTPGKEVWLVSIPPKVGGGKVVLTSYVTPKTFWDTFALSEAWCEIRNSMMMKHLGIPTAKPLACGEIRFCGRVIKSYVVSEYLPGSLSGKLMMPGGHLREDKEMRRAFARKAMELIARAHRCDFFHGDFRPGRILMSGTSTVDDMHLTMIDISKADFKPRFTNSMFFIATDLLAFFVDMRIPAKDIKELLNDYLECNPHCGFTVESLWNRLVVMGEQMG